MSSTMVSSNIGFNEFQSDYAAIRSSFHDLQRSAALDKADFASNASFAVGFSNRTALARRHSSSVFGASVVKPLAATITSTFRDTSGALVGNGLLETVAEERFRSRAYSEGSNLSCDQQQQQQAQTTSRYKTELCRPFEENGRCKYGDKCQFAHGKHELRHMVRHPKYKTELCRTYHTSGLCMYGPRCHFIHNTDELAPVSRQNSVSGIGLQTHQVSVPVTISNVIQQKRPTNLQLLSQQQQRNINQMNNAFPYPTANKVNTSPIGTPPGFFGPAEQPPLLSPVSPISATRTGPVFSFAKAPMSPMDLQGATKTFGGFDVENRQATPPLTRFDVMQGGHQYMDLSNEDAVFDPPTPPDSDRESESGSPQAGGILNNSPQRLPIFRCLSQSE
uniref:ZF(C3H) zinc finger protein n=1 Tax=Phallusia mammillata TaxID=59560 RepID=A0A6F9DYH8_9ASCI|nr:ZF(C3H) zinc finger protein [Phallusia mammillata]